MVVYIFFEKAIGQWCSVRTCPVEPPGKRAGGGLLQSTAAGLQPRLINSETLRGEGVLELECTSRKIIEDIFFLCHVKAHIK